MTEFANILIEANRKFGSIKSPRTLNPSIVKEVFDGKLKLVTENHDEDMSEPSSKDVDYRKIIRSEMIDLKRSYIPNHEILRAVCDQFRNRIRLDYELYKKMAAKMPQIMKRFFTAEIFLKLPQDSDGCVLVEDYLGYINFRCMLEETMLDVAAYAHADSGFIDELELERYIFDSIELLVPLQNVHVSMYPFYTHTAVKRFMFFLDPYKTRRVSIKKLVHSPMMREFLELRTKTQLPASNWFSYANVRLVYSQYLELDSDKKGMLCQADLLRYGGVPKGSIQLTPSVVRRAFEENISYQPAEMDYKTFLDLILALDSRKSIQSIRYFFRLVDLDGTGRLTPSAISYFYSDICKCLQSSGYDAPSLSDVTAEIFDMVSAQDPSGVTLEELLRSGQGDTVMAMLTDVSAFWRYDNREALLQSREEEEDGDGSEGGGGGETQSEYEGSGEPEGDFF